MSALRVNPPGQPVVLIPLGPARGRITAQVGGSMGCAISEQASAWAGRRARRDLAPTTERCGHIMASGHPCASRAGHFDHHRRVV